ncbi:methylated-DNA--[protein]-cysteine S-methyltransferase [Aerococcaceae bacterium zg-BR9]|uniref:methylated-DNA--[protein]-cysteine S-methyltransferase n=1 Tax=Aerococcaceae bacterium zg-1292 TaxID=2774330 RepID=UPI0040645C4D|nr:methylated-DNA--[protein]-cysteine S-methyltransferase [Aerococcaceae bacterium zg-BR9]
MAVLYKHWYDSPIGKLWLVSNEVAVKGIWFEGQRYFATGYDWNAIRVGEPEAVVILKRWLDAYFSGDVVEGHMLDIEPAGTAFQQRVWQVLQTIPYGKMMSYADIAEHLWPDSSRRSPRAIGGAVGKNPLALVIPCHRVVGHNGAITGYAAGVEKKIWLLAHEQHCVQS